LTSYQLGDIKLRPKYDKYIHQFETYFNEDSQQSITLLQNK